MPLGGRLLVRSKKDWRVAVVSRISVEGVITLSVASPRGTNYRLRRDADTEIAFDGTIPFLTSDSDDAWHENFSSYDSRW
jgi:hypothetical protein